MEANAPHGLLRAFAELKDPRVNRTKRHSLTDILGIAICATICGADGWTQVAKFGRCKLKWFRTFLDLPNGIPSHDTFGRVFAALDPAAFEACFMKWVSDLATASAGRLIAIDGKTIRRSLDAAGSKAAVHMVNAWCAANHMALGQLATDAKSNEITAVMALLEMLDLKDAVVSLDAMHCQKQTAEKIVEKEADYLIAVKDNQPTLRQDIQLFFDDAIEQDWDGMPRVEHEQVDSGHDRLEVRRLWASNQVDWLQQQGHKWAGLKGIVCVESERTTFADGKTAKTRRYYITSLDPQTVGAEHLLAYVRGHWSIENTLHWSLDVTFREDASRVRKDHGPENLAAMRRMALGLLKRTQPKTRSGRRVAIKRRRLIAGQNDAYLLNVITGE